MVVHQHGRHHLAHVRHLSAAAYDDRSRADNLLSVRILLAHRQGIFARRHVHFERTAEVGECFHRTVEARVLAFLRTAGPHPVGRQAHAVKSFLKRSPHNVGQRLRNREHTACLRRRQSGLRSVSEGSSYALAATIIQRDNAAVRQRKLQPALALLARNLARYASVNLVCKPILAGNGLQLKHAAYVFI